jgi:hypothetical protein
MSAELRLLRAFFLSGIYLSRQQSKHEMQRRFHSDAKREPSERDVSWHSRLPDCDNRKTARAAEEIREVVDNSRSEWDNSLILEQDLILE